MASKDQGGVPHAGRGGWPPSNVALERQEAQSNVQRQAQGSRPPLVPFLSPSMLVSSQVQGLQQRSAENAQGDSGASPALLSAGGDGVGSQIPPVRALLREPEGYQCGTPGLVKVGDPRRLSDLGAERRESRRRTPRGKGRSSPGRGRGKGLPAAPLPTRQSPAGVPRCPPQPDRWSPHPHRTPGTGARHSTWQWPAGTSVLP